MITMVIASTSGRSSVPILTALISYAVVATTVLWVFDGLPTVARIPLVLPLLLFAPGYAVVTAIFPSTGLGADDLSDGDAPSDRRPGPALSPGERTVLAVVVSIAVVPMVAVVVGFFVDHAVGPILAGITLVTIVAGSVAIARVPTGDPRHRTPWEGYRAVLSGSVGGSLSRLAHDRATMFAVLLAVVLLVSSAAVAFQGDDGDRPATEFYLVNETGTADVAADEAGTATFDLRVTNYGPGSQRYTVVAALHPEVGAGPQPPAGDLAVLDSTTVVVAAGETGATTIRTDRPDATGSGTVYFMLYSGDAPGSPAPATADRTLRLSVNETTG